MAVGFTEWTVLPHQPIDKLSENLWTVSGSMPKGNQRRMVIAKLRDGRLLIHNPVALDDAEMAELDAFGKVAALLVPNAFHRQDTFIWKQRYPDAKVYCPKKAIAAVSKAVPVDGDYSAAPQDSSVKLEHLTGLANAEGVLIVNSTQGTSLTFNDAVLNVETMSGFMGFVLSPTGRPSIPRVTRWMMLKDKKALHEQLLRLAGLPELQRVLPGHGPLIVNNAAEVLRSLAREFC